MVLKSKHFHSFVHWYLFSLKYWVVLFESISISAVIYRPDLFVYDKKRKEIALIEVGITNLDILTQVENEEIRFNSQWDSSDLQMQGENYTICDDLGGCGYEIPQKTQKWNRDCN